MWGRGLLIGGAVACSAPSIATKTTEPTSSTTSTVDSGTTSTTTGTTSPTPTETPPRLVFDGPVPSNLLVLSLDTTRRDAIGRYAEGPSDTPFLDGLLAQSVVLDNHRSCSNWTGPSMLCATSGLHPVDVSAMRGRTAADRLPTLARVLGAQAGFASRLATANPFFFGRQDALGFDEVTTFVGVEDGRASEVSAQLLADVGELRGSPPWYAHAHFFDPHDPYCPPAAYREGEDALPPIPFDICQEQALAVRELWETGTPEERDAVRQHVRFLYRAELRYWDDMLALLWAELESRGILDESLVVFFTDHGEQIFERDALGHAQQLFAEETRAVAAFWADNLTPGVVTAPTVHQDLAATLYPLFGAAPETPITGRPLDEVPADRPVGLLQTAFVNQSTVAVVVDDHQLTLGFDDSRSFHDLTTDPAMLDSDYDPDDPAVKAAWEVMDGFLDEVEDAFPLLFAHDREP